MFQNRPSANVIGIFRHFLCVRDFQFIHLKMGNRFDAVELVAPKLGDALRAGKAPGHTDNCDTLKQGTLILVRTQEAPPWRSRFRAKASRCFCACCWTPEKEDATGVSLRRCSPRVRTVVYSNKSV